MVAKVWNHCEASTIRGRTVTLKARFADIQQVTWSRTGELPPVSQSAVEAIGLDLLKSLFPVRWSIRLLGVTLSFFADEARRNRQMPLPIE